ncbi:ATP-dependent helicase HrpB [Candidatus Nitrospira allomarina]|uniref:ATP-dependent helicase HrpB n=1 Tax=Candidatus Nitrospira allomarina TaxID=3020900 RepID=A0AA96GCR3_9BACT|nr:ATP-dependent helicase HrpB [Candidatus Nitrospira allomarina]WNM57745.1 ATP-dependent helicase HrpB [Candidatus Nitrospira allomarina]
MKTHTYPIDAVVPKLQQTLRQHPIVLLTAQPGAGKTTQIPLALLKEPWLTKNIIMLEPRRLAARAAARRMSDLLGETVGTTVGYRTRLDTKISPNTKLEVVTEGILTRMLQHDPSLQNYGLVIFDEFHERSLQADLGLALCLESQKVFREDLRLLIMSATLDSAAISQQLKQAPVITCEGRMFPVETRYVGKPDGINFARQVAHTIHRLLKTEQGNLLVFLPGAGEIRQVERLLADLPLDPHTRIAPLYGDLSAQAQDQAILLPPAGWRKVVLSTNIAESSLTIEGIRLVIDTGLMRVPHFDSRSGMSRLATLTVSQQSAGQRRGRAGRLEPGLCIRFWSEAEQRTLTPRTTPEILDADLTSLVLELSQWGNHDPQELFWLDPPPSGAIAQARQLLHSLGACDTHGHITDHGRAMADLPMHPRLAHMVLKGKALGAGALACDLAAALSERNLFKGSIAREHADLRTRFDLLYGGAHVQRNTGAPDKGTIQRIRQVSQSWQRTLHITAPRHVSKQRIDQLGVLLALAYPDRIAQRQSAEDRRYRLANGRSARFHHPDPLEHEEWLVIADLNGAPATALIYMAAPISHKDLISHCGDLIQSTDSVMWEGSTQAVRSMRQRRLGELILEETRLPDPDPDLVLTALLDGLRNTGLSRLPWNPTLRNWQARVQFLRRATEPESAWPDVSDDTLLQSLDQWLGPFLINLSSLNQVKRIDLAWPLQALLSPEQRRTLDSLAPTHLTVPTGSHIPLDYLSGEIPVLAVRLQELFGQCDTPRLVNGRIPVLIHLLSPARRPVQVTQDLTSFWKTGYTQVRKELKGRYPKHFWPDDPFQAPPTRGIKKQ